MRAIKINTTERKVEVIDFKGDYKAIQKEIDVECFTCVGLNDEGDTLYVDDEGLFKETDFFTVEGYAQPLAGNGLILGSNENGKTIGASMEIPKIRFFSRREVKNLCELGVF